jgi:hypothetical protein
VIRSRAIIIFILLISSVSSDAFATDMTFQGKVIAADTLQPIEGAVVVAVWDEEMATIAGADVRFNDAKEALTDKNGDWSITGPKGETNNMNPYTSLLLGKYYIQEPYFVIYKPGYAKYGTPGGFKAYPYVDKKHNLEGIVLIRPGDTFAERKEHRKKYDGGFVPFEPTMNPERKLRNLDFSFYYTENVRRVGWQRGIEPFWVYTVVGLKKVTTRKERLEAIPYIYLTTDGEKEFPILSKVRNEERKKLLDSY